MTDPNKIRHRLPPDNNLPAKGMRYQEQVVWLLDASDADMKASSHYLDAKRMAAGECEKSQVVMGLDPPLKRKLPETDNIRLYVVGHGVELAEGRVGIQIASPLELKNVKEAKEFFPLLNAFITKRMPQKKVRRIALFMCNSAGLHPGGKVNQSFAFELANLCKDLTTDMTGRRGKVKEIVSEVDRSWADEEFGTDPNPLYTYEEEGKEHSVINTRKHVRGVRNIGTYIFSHAAIPELKSGYTDPDA